MLIFQSSNASSDPPFYFSAEQGSWDDDLGVSQFGDGGGDVAGDIPVLEDPLAGGEGFGQLRGGGGDLGGGAVGGAGDVLGGELGNMLSGAGGGEAGPIDQLAPAQGNPSGGNYLQRAIEVVTGKSPLFVDPGEVVVDTSRAGADWFWVCFFTILGLLALL